MTAPDLLSPDGRHPEIELLQQLTALAHPDSGEDLSAATLIRASQIAMAVWEAGLPLPQLLPHARDQLLLKWSGRDPESTQLVVHVSARWMLFALLGEDGVAAFSRPGHGQDTPNSVVELVSRHSQS